MQLKGSVDCCSSYKASGDDAGVKKRVRAHKTYPLLCELSRSLVLAVSQQFDNATLIRSKAGDLLDDVADESGALAQGSLAAGNARLGGDGCDLLQIDTFSSAFISLSRSRKIHRLESPTGSNRYGFVDRMKCFPISFS